MNNLNYISEVISKFDLVNSLEQIKADYLNLNRKNFLSKYKCNVSDYLYLMCYLKFNLSVEKSFENFYFQYFEKIKSNLPYLNYLLGVIAGDGCLLSTRYGIVWASKDVEWLQSIIAFIDDKYEFKLYNYKKKNILSSYKFTDMEFIQYCILHGLISRKSFVSGSCMVYDENYEWYFIRGLFESDGCARIIKNPKGRDSYNINIVNSESQINYLSIFLDKFGIIHNVSDKDGLFHLNITYPNSIVFFINKIYNDNLDFKLFRKFQTCQKILDGISSNGKFHEYPKSIVNHIINGSCIYPFIKEDFLSLSCIEFCKKYFLNESSYCGILNLLKQYGEIDLVNMRINYKINSVTETFQDNKKINFLRGIFAYNYNGNCNELYFSSCDKKWSYKIHKEFKFRESINEKDNGKFVSYFFYIRNKKIIKLLLDNYPQSQEDWVYFLKGFFHKHMKISKTKTQNYRLRFGLKKIEDFVDILNEKFDLGIKRKYLSNESVAFLSRKDEIIKLVNKVFEISYEYDRVSKEDILEVLK